MATKKKQDLKEAIIDLYLNVKVRSSDEVTSHAGKTQNR